MAQGWTCNIPPVLKSGASAAIAAATPTILNQNPNPDAAPLPTHFSAAQSVANSIVSALSGPATRVQILMQGYADDTSSLPTSVPDATGSRISVSVTEFA